MGIVEKKAETVTTVTAERQADNGTPYVLYRTSGFKSAIYYPKSIFVGGFEGSPKLISLPFVLAAPKVPAAKLTEAERKALADKRKAERKAETPAQKAERARQDAAKATAKAAKLTAAANAVKK